MFLKYVLQIYKIYFTKLEDRKEKQGICHGITERSAQRCRQLWNKTVPHFLAIGGNDEDLPESDLMLV